ncbi:MAG: OB-fold domain-containing protein [Kordiimonadaceae bacterium]|nr:OB-fold domain-containing protein [Kordiimonadaceae bacterium]
MEAPRTLPELDDENTDFWTSGKDGALRIARCQDCGHYIHPPSPVCPKCYSWNVKPEAVSGKAVVATYTVNHQKWLPDLEVPYLIAIVELVEQTGLRLTTNILECAIEDIYIGMPVSVVFEQQEDVYLPLFKKDAE